MDNGQMNVMPRDRKLALVGLVRARKEHAEQAYQGYYRNVAKWYDYYRGIYAGKHASFRNNIHIPFIYSVVQSDVARKVQMTFGNWPIVSFEGYADNSEGIAKKNEALISVQLEDCNSYNKAIDFYTCKALYGVGISRDGWRRDIRKEKVRVGTELAPGMVHEEVQSMWVSYFDGPDWRVVDTLDFFPQPGFRFIEDMAWVVERYYRDLDDMLDLVHAEIAAGITDTTYDLEALNELKSEASMPTVSDREMNARLSVYRTWQDFQSRSQEKYAKPVEVWEMWGTVPSEFAPDGERNRCVTILNGRIMAKNVKNPFWHGEKPYGSFAVGDPHFFHGVGTSELLAKMQAASNRLMNHKLDLMDITISPPIFVNSNVISGENYTTQPGKMNKVDGPVGGDNIMQMQFDKSGAQMATQEIELMWRYMQQGSGIVEDTVSGFNSGQSQTAREYQGRQEAVMNRLTMEARIAEENWLEKMVNRFRMMDRQYLPLPKQVEMIGQMAIRDPVTGEPLDDTISHSDLMPNYKARAVGANQAIQRGTKNDWVNMLQVMGASPMAQFLNWQTMATETMQLFGRRNPDRFLMTQDQMEQGMSLPGAPSTNPPTMADQQGSPGALQNPEALSAQHLQSIVDAPLD